MSRLARMEVIHPGAVRARIRGALFDFHGTLSLIRRGWQRVMIDLMVETMATTPGGRARPREELAGRAGAFVARSAGRETIHQMRWLAQQVDELSGTPDSPAAYKQTYRQQLLRHIAGRRAALRQGRAAPEEFLVPGARPLLAALRARGVRCFLASGTDAPDVRQETALLGIDPYFVAVYGAADEPSGCSKRTAIGDILRQGISGPELVVFGDGFVEIQESKAVGGVAVGVASDEFAPGRVDDDKRRQLAEAGADLIVPDFRDHAALCSYLCGREQRGGKR
ncbi:MAG: HAD family hydrolase [Candidatus Bipolaricaulaceae bacterium]